MQYLLGGHRAFFFESMDAMGLSRYLPVFVYAKGEPQKAGFFGHRMEGFQNENEAVLGVRAQHQKLGLGRRDGKGRRLCAPAVPKPNASAPNSPSSRSIPRRCCARRFRDSEIKDALFVLERLRARKTPEELENAAHRLGRRDRFDAGGVRRTTAPAPPRPN